MFAVDSVFSRFINVVSLIYLKNVHQGKKELSVMKAS